MKRVFITLVISLFTIAAASLIVVQFVQTKRTLSMSDNIFNISVNNAMDDFIDQVNRLKVEDYISQNDRYRLLKYRRVEQLNERMQNLVRNHYNTFYDTTLVRVGITMVDSVQFLPGVHPSSLDSSAVAQYNNLLSLRDKLTNSPEFYDQFVTDISEYVVDNIISPQSLNYEMLDSLIILQLNQQGIEIVPDIGIYDNANSAFLYCNNANKEQALMESPFKYQFAPNGMLTPTDYFILLHFPKRSLLFKENSARYLLVSLFLILTILFLFFLSIRTISKQRKLDEMKMTFINNMTHEIKTPIATIGLACEMLQDPTTASNPENAAPCINIISAENRRMRTLVETILQSAKMSNNKASFNVSPVDFHSLINSVAQSFQLTMNNRGGQLNLQLQADPSTLNADQMHLTNMIYNLIDNAIKYSPSQPVVTITTRTQGNHLIFSVADNGIGISKEDQKHVFERFYRVNTGDRHDVKGFGIGLSYVQQVVALHHGTIAIDSAPNQGSTFTISLPY